MGWQIEGAEGHEGYLAHLGPDGRGADSYGQHMGFRRRDDGRIQAAWDRGETPTEQDMYELVPWNQLTGWRTECECGWRGTTWSRSDVGLDDGDDDALVFPKLPDGSALEDKAGHEWEQHVAPTVHLKEVTTAAADLRAAHKALDAAVAHARAESPSATWEQIGKAVGITAHAAQDRWAASTTAPAHSGVQDSRGGQRNTRDRAEGIPSMATTKPPPAAW